MDLEAHPESQVWAMIEGVAKQPIGVKASLLDRVAERKPIGAIGGRIGLPYTRAPEPTWLQQKVWLGEGGGGKEHVFGNTPGTHAHEESIARNQKATLTFNLATASARPRRRHFHARATQPPTQPARQQASDPAGQPANQEAKRLPDQFVKVWRFCGSTVLRFGGLAVGQFGGSAVLRFCDSAVLRFCGLAVWRFGGSAVLRFCGSDKLKMLKVETLKS